MKNFITILTFTHPTELAIIRGRLESEGIETFVQDELTAQTNPLYSNAIGGVKLQVKDEDFELATEILRENGYIKDTYLNQLDFLSNFQRKLDRYKLLRRFRPEYVILILLVLVIGSATALLFYVTRKTNYDMFTESVWCVNEVEYLGKNYYPNTVQYVYVTGPGFCKEGLTLYNKAITLPGFNSSAANGIWSFDKDSLRISSCDTFGFVYNGQYAIEIHNNQMILSSNTTQIRCVSNNFYFHF